MKLHEGRDFVLFTAASSVPKTARHIIIAQEYIKGGRERLRPHCGQQGKLQPRPQTRPRLLRSADAHASDPAHRRSCSNAHAHRKPVSEQRLRRQS